MPTRPQSIIRFEWTYAAVILLGLVQTMLQWNSLTANPDVQPVVAAYGPGLLYGLAALLLLAQVLLWHLTARRRSNVARWVLVVITLYVLFDTVQGVITAGLRVDGPVILGIAQIVLQVAALVLLVQADARAWFGADATPV